MDHSIPHPELYRVPYVTDSWHGMPYRTVGVSGLRAPLVGIGTWKFGLPETGDGARVDEKTAFAIFDRAIELGVTFWDTANRYNDASGNSERVIGRWLRANPAQRRNVIVCTKVFGGMDGTTPNHCRLSRQNIIESVYACLKRLDQEYIDLLYFHSFDPTTPIEESLAAIEDLVQRDMVRYFGLSNFSVEQLRAYDEAASYLSPRCRAVAVENRYNLLAGEDRNWPASSAGNERPASVLEYCAQSGLSFVAWSPLAQGLLTDRYLDLSKVGKGDRLFDEDALAGVLKEGVLSKQQALAALAQEWALPLSVLALAYMLTLPGMGPLIPSASSVRQLEANARAGTTTLSEEQKARVRAVLA